MNWLMRTGRDFWSWMRRSFDFALILAALVEVPRWAVAFYVIGEPWIIGIPLGILLAYAAAEGWRGYFLRPSRWILLCFNVASLVAAIFVITPVLYAMALGPIESIDLSTIMSTEMLIAWSCVLALTTFAPLIQLAAVKAGSPLQTPSQTAVAGSRSVGNGISSSRVPNTSVTAVAEFETIPSHAQANGNGHVNYAMTDALEPSHPYQVTWLEVQSETPTLTMLQVDAETARRVGKSSRKIGNVRRAGWI